MSGKDPRHRQTRVDSLRGMRRHGIDVVRNDQETLSRSIVQDFCVWTLRHIDRS